VLNFPSRHVPVFDLFVQEADLREKVLLVDLSRFARWDQYVPMDAEEDQPYIAEFLYVRVTDLNTDDERREALIREDPTWLHNEVDKDRFLRGRVILNIYEKFKVHVMDASAGVAWNVTRTAEDEA
jgi:hypothetical protein